MRNLKTEHFLTKKIEQRHKTFSVHSTVRFHGSMTHIDPDSRELLTSLCRQNK